MKFGSEIAWQLWQKADHTAWPQQVNWQEENLSCGPAAVAEWTVPGAATTSLSRCFLRALAVSPTSVISSQGDVPPDVPPSPPRDPPRLPALILPRYLVLEVCFSHCADRRNGLLRCLPLAGTRSNPSTNCEISSSSCRSPPPEEPSRPTASSSGPRSLAWPALSIQSYCPSFAWAPFLLRLLPHCHKPGPPILPSPADDPLVSLLPGVALLPLM